MGVSQFHVILIFFFFDYLNWNNIHTTLSTSEQSLTNRIENTIRKCLIIYFNRSKDLKHAQIIL